jgi:hypothetical protein
MKTYIDYYKLVDEFGEDQALIKFEEFKNSPPTEALNRDFADYLMAQLPNGFMDFEYNEWGLESEDSDSFLEWCEQCHFKIPSLNASIFVEVGNYHYFVSVDTEDGYSECETVKYQDAIIELLLEWTEQIKEEATQ